jgi:hypothetical protein
MHLFYNYGLDLSQFKITAPHVDKMFTAVPQNALPPSSSFVGAAGTPPITLQPSRPFVL